MSDGDLETATFGAGCFWGIEERFSHVKGVRSTMAGYAGGTLQNPTYEEVCTGRTGHTEVVQVRYDPSEVSYDDLLGVFWTSHDPTSGYRHGRDRGTQYRSVIFYHCPHQQAAAYRSKQELDGSGEFRSTIVTQIEPVPTFYRAEEYHQQYLKKRSPGACDV